MSISRRLLLLMIISLGFIRSSQVQAQNVAANDPQVAQQWAISRIGLECAWQHTTGSSNVTVAVIDSGVDLNHPDLVAALRDDGFNTVDENNNPTDLNGHGTHVAGIIAATINNNEGVAGIAGGGTKILPIRVMDAIGQGTNADIAEGIRYAIAKDVQIINMSLGSLLPLGSEEIVAAIQEAHAAGILVIIAAGNSYVPLPNFSFGIEEFALVVAATDERDLKTDFSNYGPWIGLSAPGYQIMSTMPTYDVFLTRDLPPEERFRKNYDVMSGTSQATPVIAGVAALLFAQHPDWTAQQVRAELERTAANIRDLNPAKKFGPVTYFDPDHLGAGRVDACEALGGPLGAVTVGDQNFALPWVAIAIASVIFVVGFGLLLMRRRSRANRTPLPAGSYGAGFPPAGTPVAPPHPVPAQPYVSQPVPPAAATPPATTPAWGKLTILSGSAEQPQRFLLLRDATTTIGRDPSANLIINDPTVSRLHARIRKQGSQVILEDINSSHGTFVDNQRVTQPTVLYSGRVIRLGNTQLRFEA